MSADDRHRPQCRRDTRRHRDTLVFSARDAASSLLSGSITSSPKLRMCGTNADLPNKGGGSVNQLGGMFLNGRPLPESKRRKMIELASEGVRPSQISRILRVSNGCVSKILSRYRRTGLVEPKSIGGSRPRLLTPSIISTIIRCKRDNPAIFAWEIRKRLVAAAWKTSRVPSVSSINRILRKIHMDHGPMFMESNERSSAEQDFESLINPDQKPKGVQQRKRTILTPEQSEALEQEFVHSQYADMHTRERLSAKVRLPEDTIKVWFSNRRARCRREAKHGSCTQNKQRQRHTAPVSSSMEPSVPSQQVTGVARIYCANSDVSPTFNTVASNLQNSYSFPAETGLGSSDHLPRISWLPSFPCPSDDVMALTTTDRTPLAPRRDGFTFPLVPLQSDSRTSLPLITEAGRADHPVTQCWSQRGMSFTWSQVQTDERLLFTQQPWDVNPHRYLD